MGWGHSIMPVVNLTMVFVNPSPLKIHRGMYSMYNFPTRHKMDSIRLLWAHHLRIQMATMAPDLGEEDDHVQASRESKRRWTSIIEGRSTSVKIRPAEMIGEITDVGDDVTDLWCDRGDVIVISSLGLVVLQWNWGQGSMGFPIAALPQGHRHTNSMAVKVLS